MRESTESHCRSSDSGVSGLYSGSGSGKSNVTNLSVGVGAQTVPDWRRQHAVSWRHLILSTLPAQHTRLERQEEELCRKFERLYQRNKKYERKLNRYNQALRTVPNYTKTYWDYPQRCWDIYSDTSALYKGKTREKSSEK